MTVAAIWVAVAANWVAVPAILVWVMACVAVSAIAVWVDRGIALVTVGKLDVPPDPPEMMITFPPETPEADLVFIPGATAVFTNVGVRYGVPDGRGVQVDVSVGPCGPPVLLGVMLGTSAMAAWVGRFSVELLPEDDC
ncbi:MAG: hypothetical protein IAF02_04780 [Anaerolineae bacterium]|nr:hypothetical protein [Anaerolineae bacterium]